MSPLRVENSDGVVIHPNEEFLSFNEWGEVLGVDRGTVKRAARRGEVKITTVLSLYMNVAPAQGACVGEFPEMLKGFQETTLNPNDTHFHPWALDAKNDPDGTVRVTGKDGKKLTFTP